MPILNLVHMGDSITSGQHIDPGLRWTSLVDERLLNLLSGSPVELRSINRGVSGETTRQGLERFPRDVQDFEPPVMTLQFGLNDCNCWQTDRGLPRVSAAAFESNLLEMIVRAQKFGAREIILANNHRTLRRTRMVSGELYEDANARYSEIARGVATRSGVTFCDLRLGFEPFTDAELEKLLLPEPDLLHLSIRGNRVYADVIWPQLEAAVRSWVQDLEEVVAT